MTSRRRLLLSWLAPLLLQACHAQDDTCKENGVCTNVCGLYLAPSTIPNAGLGVFTTVPLEQGKNVPLSGDVCIPIVDLRWHNGYNNFYWPMEDYIWLGGVMGMSQEVVGKDISALCVGAMDCAVNCNLALINVGKARPEWDVGNLHRSKDPGAGAITPYHNGTTTVVVDIPAGGELFKFYGNNWYVFWYHGMEWDLL